MLCTSLLCCNCAAISGCNSHSCQLLSLQSMSSNIVGADFFNRNTIRRDGYTRVCFIAENFIYPRFVSEHSVYLNDFFSDFIWFMQFFSRLMEERTIISYNCPCNLKLLGYAVNCLQAFIIRKH